MSVVSFLPKVFDQRFSSTFPPWKFKFVNKMEAIEIKNCSSTLPTLSQGVIPSKRLCKTLFGPVDHEELSNILDFELSRELKKKNEEWCFNFAEGTPVKHGPLVWEEMKQRNDEKPSTELQGKPCKEQRVPNLHSETIHCSDGMFNCQPNTPVKSTTTTPSQLKISPDAVTSENPSADIEGPLVLERKRKRQCRTITGNSIDFLFDLSSSF